MNKFVVASKARTFNLNLTDPAERAVAVFLADITDRRGLSQEWDQIDQDIRQEIVATLTAAFREAEATTDWPGPNEFPGPNGTTYTLEPLPGDETS